MSVRSDMRSGFPDAEQVTVREGVSGVVGLVSASATGSGPRFVLVFACAGPVWGIPWAIPGAASGVRGCGSCS